jgi:hypothetical protein
MQSQKQIQNANAVNTSSQYDIMRRFEQNQRVSFFKQVINIII